MVSAEPADHGWRLLNICSQIYWVRFCYHVFFKCDPVYASCSCAFAGVRGAAVYQHGSVAGKSMAENQKGRTSCLWKAAGNVCFGCYHNINAGGADFRVGLGRNGRLGGRFMDLDRDYHGCSAGFWFYRPSRRENWVLQIVAGLGIGIILFGGWSASLIGGSMDREEMLSAAQKLPLVLTDYSRTDEEITFSYYKERSSILGTMLSGTIEYGYPPEEGGTVGEEQERLSYTVYRSDVPWLLEQVWREEIKSGNYQEYDWMTKAEVGYERWGAKEVMRRNWEDNSLYVRYENAILTLYTTKPP